MKWILIGLCVLGWGGVAFAAETNQTYFEIYAVGLSDPNVIEKAVKGIVGEGGSVILDQQGGRLLVVATADQHQTIKDLVRKLDVPPVNVRIDVEVNSAGESHQAGAAVSASGGMERYDGLSSATIKIQPRVENQTMGRQSHVRQSILVASGREGLLRVGERVPYLIWLMEYGVNWGYAQSTLHWQRVGAGLMVQPIIIGAGPMIRVRLVPQLSGLVDGNPYQVRFMRVSTEVIVQDGQRFQIGGMDQDAAFFSRFLVGIDETGEKQSLSVFLTPHILPAGGGTPVR